MASPTRAEIETQIGKVVKIANELRKFVGTHVAAGSSVNVGDNYLNMEDSANQNLESNYADLYGSSIAGVRSNLVAALRSCGAMMEPGLRDYGHFVGATERGLATILSRIYDYMMDNTLRVTSRQFSFGSPTFSGAAGNGAIYRLNVDDRGQDIESQTADAKQAECTADFQNGARHHEEMFYFRGGSAERDILKTTGSGRAATIAAMSGHSAQRYLSNPSFSSYSGTSITALTAITDWTPTGAISNYQLSQSDYYRDFDGDATPASVRYLTDDTLTQAFSVKRASFDSKTPYYAQIAFKRESSCDGTLTLRMGSKTVAVALSAQSGWTILQLPLTTDRWFRNWDQEGAYLSVQLSGRTTGTLLVDDVTIGPFSRFDGSYYAVVGGSTPFLYRDRATWTDTETLSILQWAFWFFFGVYMPSTTGGGVTWAEPS